MQHPEFIIDPLGQLHRFDHLDGAYRLEKDAPILNPQWLVGCNYAITEEGKIYDVSMHTIVEIEGYEHLKFKGAIKHRGTEYGNQHQSIQVVLIDTDDNLYQCGYDHRLTISHKIATKVTHAFLNYHDVIYHTKDGGWASRSNRTRRPIDAGRFPPIEEINFLGEDCLITDTEIIRFGNIEFLKFTPGISEITVSYPIGDDDEYEPSILALIDGVINVPSLGRWHPIDNPIIHELGEACPWIKLLPLDRRTIGALNANGQLYSISEEHINRFSIPPGLMISHNTHKSAANKIK